MLLGNYNVFNSSPGRAIGGPTDPTLSLKVGSYFNFYVGDSLVADETLKSSFFNGYYPPFSYLLALVAGGLGSTTIIGGEGDLDDANLAGGKNGTADLVGSGSITNADLALVVSAVAALVGSGLFTADVVGKLEASADLAGLGDLEGALGALASAVASIIGTGSISEADMRALAFMTADITPFTELSPESLAASVWNAMAAAYNNSGTMGEKLNAAGTAGDPWTTDLSGYNTPDTAGKKLKDLKNAKLVIDELIINEN